MAEISILTEKLSYNSAQALNPWQLGNLLSQLGHNVSMITTEGEDAPLNSKVQLQRPFQNWSWSEMLRFLPRFLVSAPDILLLIQPSEAQLKRSLNPLFLALLGLKQGLKTEVVCYFHSSINHEFSASFKELLNQSDVIVCSAESLLLELQDIASAPRDKNKWRVIPVLDDLKQSAASQRLIESETESLELIGRFQNILLIPYGLARFADKEVILNAAEKMPENLFVIINGYQGLNKKEQRQIQATLFARSIHNRVYLTGPTSEAFVLEVAKKAKALLIAPLEITGFEHEYIHSLSLESLTPAIISKAQLQTFSDIWTEGQDCLVLQDTHATTQLIDFILKDFDLPIISPEYSTKHRLKSKDEIVNLWARLFAEPHEPQLRQ